MAVCGCLWTLLVTAGCGSKSAVGGADGGLGGSSGQTGTGGSSTGGAAGGGAATGGAPAAGGKSGSGGATSTGGSAAPSGSWAGIIDPSRAVDWTTVGVPGGIPTRTNVCATVAAGSTAAQINAAIAGCASGGVVMLAAGSFNLSSSIDFAGKTNVTLRGAGADKTLVTFSSSVSCRGQNADVCVDSGDTNWAGGPSNAANWTAGYARGATSITLDKTTNLKVGSPLFLDQMNDDATGVSDDGNIYVCTEVSALCNDDGPSGGPGGASRTGRDQTQIVTVTSINGNQVGISPGLYMPNWRASQTPGAWWATSPTTGVGVEDLSLDHTASNDQAGIMIFNCSGCWVSGVRSITSNRSHVWMYYSNRIEVRQSYFFGTLNDMSESYGVETFPSADSLIDNNVFQQVTAPQIMTGACSGCVVGYNFSINDTYTKSLTWMQQSASMHAAGIDNVLLEGNVGAGLGADLYHGSHHFVTAFRNRWNGYEAGKDSNTLPVRLWPRSRFFNIVGNVFGDLALPQTNYQVSPTASGNFSLSIYELGTGLVNITYQDPAVGSTLLRWGNYDIVTGAPRFDAGEVPSAIAQFANAVPASQTLPASFYLTAKPATWGAMPWPAIGPDVSGGDIPGVGGHAYKIPAEICYESLMKGPADGSGAPLTFNAAACYP